MSANKIVTLYTVWTPPTGHRPEVASVQAVEQPTRYYIAGGWPAIGHYAFIAKDDPRVSLSEMGAIERAHNRLQQEIANLEARRVKAQETQLQLNALRLALIALQRQAGANHETAQQ